MQITVPGAMGMGRGALARDDQGAHTERVNNRSDNEQMLVAGGPRSGPGHIPADFFTFPLDEKPFEGQEADV
jgi:hypothetical protein